MAELNTIEFGEAPAPSKRSNKTVMYVVAAIVVLCCLCFGALGLIIAFLPSILSELGLA